MIRPVTLLAHWVRRCRGAAPCVCPGSGHHRPYPPPSSFPLPRRCTDAAAATFATPPMLHPAADLLDSMKP
ncbi:hypothetical protein BDA96_02G132000 [Sorghum bicolor]|uniref:Uncharacterized protein n=2 Tax=Sorghum bicolor TaxID=4558 RepID=A0A921RM40_SORBI|nr:hypothetical protein BDA96_02G132000 [Sorghum bicolor]KXG35049.1 hypothetical protein SORBI_3002G125600 [Sorghum bicolor]